VAGIPTPRRRAVCEIIAKPGRQAPIKTQAESRSPHPRPFREVTMSIAIVRALRIVAVVVMVLAAPFVAIAVIGALGLAGLYVHSRIIPAKSGEVFFPEIDTTVRLRFYYTWGDESGRFVTVTTRNGTIRGSIEGWDWAHYARTSIYVTPEGNVAILGQSEYDYMIDSKTLQLTQLLPGRVSSERWKYMGAFDTGQPALHFYPASEQKECIPMLREYHQDMVLPRNEYRKRRCDMTTEQQ
jgi:hypothetical protein